MSVAVLSLVSQPRRGVTRFRLGAVRLSSKEVPDSAAWNMGRVLAFKTVTVIDFQNFDKKIPRILPLFD